MQDSWRSKVSSRSSLSESSRSISLLKNRKKSQRGVGPESIKSDSTNEVIETISDISGFSDGIKSTEK